MNRGGWLALTLAVCFCPSSSEAQSFAIRPKGVSGVLEVNYFLTGAFGGYGSFVRNADKDGAYRIPLQSEGKPAMTLKAILYAPGCKFQILSVDLGSDGTRSAVFACRPLSTITVRGAVSPPPVSAVPLDVEMDYLAFWDHKFYGMIEGMVQQFKLAKAPLNAQGRFQIVIPDFSKDGVTTEKQGAALQVTVREHKSWNIVEIVLPPAELAYGNGLKILPAYTSEITFVAAPGWPLPHVDRHQGEVLHGGRNPWRPVLECDNVL